MISLNNEEKWGICHVFLRSTWGRYGNIELVTKSNKNVDRPLGRPKQFIGLGPRAPFIPASSLLPGGKSLFYLSSLILPVFSISAGLDPNMNSRNAGSPAVISFGSFSPVNPLTRKTHVTPKPKVLLRPTKERMTRTWNLQSGKFYYLLSTHIGRFTPYLHLQLIMFLCTYIYLLDMHKCIFQRYCQIVLIIIDTVK